jgi:hypothetical protein
MPTTVLDFSLEAFQRVKESILVTEEECDSAFEGYALRDVILAKWDNVTMSSSIAWTTWDFGKYI